MQSSKTWRRVWRLLSHLIDHHGFSLLLTYENLADTGSPTMVLIISMPATVLAPSSG